MVLNQGRLPDPNVLYILLDPIVLLDNVVTTLLFNWKLISSLESFVLFRGSSTSFLDPLFHLSPKKHSYLVWHRCYKLGSSTRAFNCRLEFVAKMSDKIWIFFWAQTKERIEKWRARASKDGFEPGETPKPHWTFFSQLRFSIENRHHL